MKHEPENTVSDHGWLPVGLHKCFVFSLTLFDFTGSNALNNKRLSQQRHWNSPFFIMKEIGTVQVGKKEQVEQVEQEE
jgi:hypothetical protein